MIIRLFLTLLILGPLAGFTDAQQASLTSACTSALATQTRANTAAARRHAENAPAICTCFVRRLNSRRGLTPQNKDDFILMFRAITDPKAKSSPGIKRRLEQIMPIAREALRHCYAASVAPTQLNAKERAALRQACVAAAAKHDATGNKLLQRVKANIGAYCACVTDAVQKDAKLSRKDRQRFIELYRYEAAGDTKSWKRLFGSYSKEAVTALQHLTIRCMHKLP